MLLRRFSAGRSCPLSYRYSPAKLRALAPAAPSQQCAYVIGGLYGNEPALEEVFAMAAREEAVTGVAPLLVWNGDFNWFNCTAEGVTGVNRRLMASCDAGRSLATRGNVEVEMSRGAAEAAGARGGDGGCGCSYPGYVSDGVVARSNAIMAGLAAATRELAGGGEGAGEGDGAAVARWLADLPMHARVDVGGLRVCVVHGDAHSLSGWSFAAEAMLPRDEALHAALGLGGGGGAGVVPTTPLEMDELFDAVGVDCFACTHTCLPFAQRFGGGMLVNNGSAGMPNFRVREPCERHGVLTRIAVTPACDLGAGASPGPASLLYGASIAGVRVEAHAVRYDDARWRESFLSQHPLGGAAHTSYFGRIENGADFTVAQADRLSL